MCTSTNHVGKVTYKRHQPEKTLLYRVLAREWDGWFAERQADSGRSPLPPYVEREFEAFFRCGILAHGFIVTACEKCGQKLPVAFSCKKRGFCASCAAKRASETSLHLIDNVMPHVAFRQWVTTFPYALRFWMAASRKLTNMVHRLVANRIMHYYLHAANERGIKDPQAGGVTFLQRFGSALNLNLHLHSVVMDGVFSVSGSAPVFYQLRGPTDEELADIVTAVANDVVAALRNKDYLPEEGAEIERPKWLDSSFAESQQLAVAAEASTKMGIAFGERSGQKVRRIGRSFGYEDETPLVKGKRCYSVNGFTIHANRYIGAQERSKLQELLSYGARGAFSNERLSLVDPEKPHGNLKYTLKRLWSDGTEAIVLSPAELVEKLVALIPPPYCHMSRYFGVLSSHSRWRRKIIVRPHVKKGFVSISDGSVQPMSWSRLLARVFSADILRCHACGGKLYAESFEMITSAPMIAGILMALGLSFRVPPRQRGPPCLESEYLDMDQRQPCWE